MFLDGQKWELNEPKIGKERRKRSWPLKYFWPFVVLKAVWWGVKFIVGLGLLNMPVFGLFNSQFNEKVSISSNKNVICCAAKKNEACGERCKWSYSARVAIFLCAWRSFINSWVCLGRKKRLNNMSLLQKDFFSSCRWQCKNRIWHAYVDESIVSKWWNGMTSNSFYCLKNATEKSIWTWTQFKFQEEFKFASLQNGTRTKKAWLR